MATVINNPSTGESTGGGFAIGVILVILVALGLFFVYGLPAIRDNGPSRNVDVNVNVPTPTNNNPTTP